MVQDSYIPPAAGSISSSGPRAPRGPLYIQSKMRTTLKRGVGRSIAANGNGNGHSILPPAPLSPMVRYTLQPPPGRGFIRWAGRFFFALLALLVMCATAAFAGTWFYGEDTV